MGQEYQAPHRTILCIDDDESILHYEKMLLERSGYTVLTASSPQRGLSLATMCRCDLVLLDYEMPEISGHEIALALRRLAPNLTIIFVSGKEVPGYALALVDGFVPKLEASRQLLPMVAELCSRSQAQKNESERNAAPRHFAVRERYPDEM